MTQDALPEDLRRFVLVSIGSVPYLEAMLLFHGDPGHALSVTQVARLLYLNERGAFELVQALSGAGIVSEQGEAGRYRYAPVDEGLASMIDRLAHAYATDLVGVTNLIHASTHKTALRFADAFKLRKDG